MDHGMLLRLVPTLAAAAAVSLLVRRARRVGAAGAPRGEGAGGAPSFGLPPAFWKIPTWGGAAFLVFPLLAVAGALAEGRPPLEQWEAELGFVAFAALAALAGRHYRTWRLMADGEGLHLRRLLLPSLDLPWGEVDCVALTDRGQGVCLVAGGRRRASFPSMYIASGDDPALLRGACREHGVPMCLEEELPDGVMGPHGLERHGMEDWKVVALFFAGFVLFCVVFVVLAYHFARRP